jgi:shikimate dehydrogenase
MGVSWPDWDEICTLDEVQRQRAFCGRRAFVSGHPMAAPDRFLLAAVMGWPISQSRSPALHNFWFAQHGLSGSYVPLAIPPERLEAALRSLPALNFSGCNLTIPLKQDAMRIVDEVDITAKRIGAISCVVVRKDGSLSGFNNDWYGFTHNILDVVPDWRADLGPVAVMGASTSYPRRPWSTTSSISRGRRR